MSRIREVKNQLVDLEKTEMNTKRLCVRENSTSERVICELKVNLKNGPKNSLRPFLYNSCESIQLKRLPLNLFRMRGFNVRMAAEWFVNCYRLTLYDDHILEKSSCTHGLCTLPSTVILLDLLKFCVLAVRRGIVPNSFPWNICLSQYGQLLQYTFEKDDALEKYGRGNIFSSILGVSSMRLIAAVIYGIEASSFCTEINSNDDSVVVKVGNFLAPLQQLHGMSVESFVTAIEHHIHLQNIFNEYGGAKLWISYLIAFDQRRIPAQPCNDMVTS
jgi:hypothetical protein